ncbi:MAG TPA: hypothetical protein VI139_04765, partial [Gemmatimonadales bacterium]
MVAIAVALTAGCSDATAPQPLSGRYTVTAVHTAGDTLFSGTLDLTQILTNIHGSSDLQWRRSGTTTGGPLEGRLSGDSVTLNLEPGVHVDVWFLLNGTLTTDGVAGTW